MANYMQVGNIKIVQKGKSISINGIEIPKELLKRSLFGGNGISTVQSSGNSATIKIGPNVIKVKNGKEITVNGKSLDGNVEEKEKVKPENPKNSKFIVSLADEDSREENGVELHRIIAVKDIVVGGKVLVRAGEKGGFVESLDNLSESGSCWIYGDAAVFSQSRVTDDAIVRDDAMVYNYSYISGNAVVKDNAEVYNHSSVSGRAVVSDNAEVYNHSSVSDRATVRDNAEVYNHTSVSGNACVMDNAEVYNHSTVSDNVQVSDHAEVTNSIVKENVKVIKRGKIINSTEKGDKTVSEKIGEENSSIIIKNGSCTCIGSNNSVVISGRSMSIVNGKIIRGSGNVIINGNNITNDFDDDNELE